MYSLFHNFNKREIIFQQTHWQERKNVIKFVMEEIKESFLFYTHYHHTFLFCMSSPCISQPESLTFFFLPYLLPVVVRV